MIEKSIVFDNKKLNIEHIPMPVPVSKKEDENMKFGLLTLKTNPCSLTEKKLDLIFQVDSSGSMSDVCTDNRTKMQHILHTLKNMILFFKKNPSLNVHITIHAFDDKIYNIVDRTIVDITTYENIIHLIDTIEPRGATNLEKALQNIKNYTNQLKKEHPDTTIHHIFMTDGRTTVGSDSFELLKECVDDSYTNVFIGFGIDHDAALLNTIGSGNNSANYFIDQLENAGFVYGEILHGFVYNLFNNIVLTVNNGLIYDFKTNTWNDKLKVTNIVGETIKYYHIVSNNPENCSIEMFGNKSEDNSNIYLNIKSESEESDLTKYIYRQRTQQILYEINDYLKTKNFKLNSFKTIKIPFDEEDTEVKNYINKKEYKNNLKMRLHDLFTELKQYMEVNDLKEDIFLKNLCDDIYICYRTLGTKFAEMFCSSRMTSQGNQYAYTATQIPEQESNNMDFKNILPPILEHSVSNSLSTPYRTPTKLEVMRSVSNGMSI